MNNLITTETLNIASHIFIIIDQKGTITFFNKKAEQTFKTSHEKLINETSFLSLLDPSWLTQHTNHYINSNFQLLLKKIPLQQEFECHCINSEGKPFSLFLCIDPLPDGHYLLIGRKWKKSTNNSEYELIRKLNHEIRGSLNSIIGFSTLLLEKGAINEKTRSLLEKISNSGKRLNALMDATSYYYNVDYGQIEPNYTDVSLSQVIDDLLKKNKEYAAIKTEIPKKLKPIQTDKDMIRQVLKHLVDNSLKYTDQGLISVKLNTDPKTNEPISIEIIDNGIGIKPDQIQDIFRPFMRFDCGAFNRKRGHGLGLATVKSLCNLFGYRLKVESQEGKGTRFTIIL